jgi:HEAT repeat protein
MIKLIARSASPDSMKDVIRILARYLSSNNARIRYSATEALSQLGSKEATDALKQAVAGESNANVKRLMEAALRNR